MALQAFKQIENINYSDSHCVWIVTSWKWIQTPVDILVHDSYVHWKRPVISISTKVCFEVACFCECSSTVSTTVCFASGILLKRPTKLCGFTARGVSHYQFHTRVAEIRRQLVRTPIYLGYGKTFIKASSLTWWNYAVIQMTGRSAVSSCAGHGPTLGRTNQRATLTYAPRQLSMKQANSSPPYLTLKVPIGWSC